MTRHAPIRTSLTAATVAGAALLTVAACQVGTPTVTAMAATATAAAEATDPPVAMASSTSVPPAPRAAGTPTTTTTTTTAAAAATPPALLSASVVGKGTGGPGSLTVAVTSPVAVVGHVDTAVSCQTAGVRYVATASGSIKGYTVSDAVRIARYDGPGSYPALVSVSVTGPQADDAVSAVPATAEITAAGGDISFSATSDAGRTLAGSLSWACSA